MNQTEAVKFALQKFVQHGLMDWGVKISARMRRISGCCDYRKREIRLASWIFQPGAGEKIRDTILHEIAHAMTPGAHHGPAWKVAAMAIGAKPNRCFNADDYGMVRPQGRYSVTCAGCGRTHYKHRRTDRAYKCNCGHDGILYFKRNS